MKKNYTASKILNTILRLTFCNYLKVRFRLRADCDEIKDLKGPYIIIGNHTNNWDPFLLSCFIKEPVHFVAGEGNYKNPFLRWALTNLVGAIPKTKFMPDSATIREIIKVKNNNGIIGIFPEGQSNWHGVTGELMYSTAKLIKSLKLPVVTVVLKGAYLTRPRWAKKSGRGKVELNYLLALTPDDIKNLTTDEIFKRISEKLYYDEMQWQKTNNIAFKGTTAERLELFLFACPHCSSLEAFISKGNELRCTSCGYSINYDKYGTITSKSNILYFNNLYRWDKWQLELLEKKVDNLSNNEALFQHNAVTIYESKRMTNFYAKYSGGLTLYKDKLVFKYADGHEAAFYLNDLDGVNVNLNRRIEFFYNKVMYRVAFNKRYVSAYMWVSAIDYLKKGLG